MLIGKWIRMYPSKFCFEVPQHQVQGYQEPTRYYFTATDKTNLSLSV